MCFQGKKTLWIAQNPFGQSKNHQIWGQKATYDPSIQVSRMHFLGKFWPAPLPRSGLVRLWVLVCAMKISFSEIHWTDLRPQKGHQNKTFDKEWAQFYLDWNVALSLDNHSQLQMLEWQYLQWHPLFIIDWSCYQMALLQDNSAHQLWMLDQL